MASLGNETRKPLGILVADSVPSEQSLVGRSSQKAALDAILAEWATDRPLAQRGTSDAGSATVNAPVVRKADSTEQLAADEVFSVVW